MSSCAGSPVSVGGGCFVRSHRGAPRSGGRRLHRLRDPRCHPRAGVGADRTVVRGALPGAGSAAIGLGACGSYARLRAGVRERAGDTCSVSTLIISFSSRQLMRRTFASTIGVPNSQSAPTLALQHAAQAGWLGLAEGVLLPERAVGVERANGMLVVLTPAAQTSATVRCFSRVHVSSVKPDRPPLEQKGESRDGSRNARGAPARHHPRPRPASALCRRCVDCAATCTSYADADLGEPDVQELVRCVRLCLDCADTCDATGRILIRQTDADLGVLRAAIEACAVACRACADGARNTRPTTSTAASAPRSAVAATRPAATWSPRSVVRALGSSRRRTGSQVLGGQIPRLL